MKTIEGYQSFDQVRKSIGQLGLVISSNSGNDKLVNRMRIASMRSLLDLFEKYTEKYNEND